VLVAKAGDSVTTATVLVAFGAGAIGALLTASIAYSGRLLRVRREVQANERALRILDRHLETWVTDDTVRLRRQLAAITNSMVADPETGRERNLLWSSEHGVQIVRAKEVALQTYRDQERTAESQAADIRAREGRVHGLVRAWSRGALSPELRAPGNVAPILDYWAAPVTRHLSAPTDAPLPVDDPRARTLARTLADLKADPKALI